MSMIIIIGDDFDDRQDVDNKDCMMIVRMLLMMMLQPL